MTAYCVYGNHTIVIGNFRQGRIVHYSQGINFFHLPRGYILCLVAYHERGFHKKIIPHILFLAGFTMRGKGATAQAHAFLPKVPNQ